MTHHHCLPEQRLGFGAGVDGSVGPQTDRNLIEKGGKKGGGEWKWVVSTG